MSEQTITKTKTIRILADWPPKSKADKKILRSETMEFL